jgi:hypothetical protein
VSRMASALFRRHTILTLAFVTLWAVVLGVFAYTQGHLLVHDQWRVREAEPFEWVPFTLPRVTLEVAVLYLVLRPNSFRWSLGRVGIALTLFTAWLIYSGEFGLHSPAWVYVHYFWLLLVCVGLIVALIVCLLGKWLGRNRVAV